MATIAGLHVTLSLQAKTFNNGLRQAQREIRAFQSTIKPTTKLLEGLSSTAVRAGRAMTYGLSVPAGAVLALGLRFNAMYEQAEMGFTTMLGSAERARTFLGGLKDFAATTPFEFPELVENSQRLMAMGFAANQVLPILKTAGNASAAMGRGGENIDRITLALGQMRLKTRVMTQEMNQLTEAGVNGWKYISQAMGVTEAQLPKLIEQGLVPANKAIDAIVNGVGRDYGNMMEKQSQTAKGLISTLKDESQFISGELTNSFFNFARGPLKTLTSGMHEFRVQLQSNGDSGLAAALGGIALAAAIAGPALYGLGQAGFAVGGLVQGAAAAKTMALWLGTMTLGLGKISTLGELLIGIKLYLAGIGAAGAATFGGIAVAAAGLVVQLVRIVGLLWDISAARRELDRASKEENSLRSRQTPAMYKRAAEVNKRRGRAGPSMAAQPAFVSSPDLTPMPWYSYPVYERGTPYVPETGPAILHKGEAVVPADQNRGGQGVTIVQHFHISGYTNETITRLVRDEVAPRLKRMAKLNTNGFASQES